MRQSNILLTVILFFILTLELRAQKADYSTLKKVVEAKFWIDLDTINLCNTIIFDGIVFDSLSINKELKKYKQPEIIVTELADLKKTTILHNNCDFLILLGTGYNQSKDDKLKLLNSIRTNLNKNVPELIIHDFKCNQCMQVIIEGQPYGIYDAKKIVNKLKVNDIKYIAHYESANPSIYGQNAKNGLVEIYLIDN